MKRLLFALLAAVAFVPASSAQPTGAPPMAALGKPLPDPSMAAGSVSVRVVAGGPAAPVSGIDVTLLVGAQPHQARTDASGRAVFNGLPAGATVKAKIMDAEGKELFSDPFPVPSSGGARLMLSTKPFGGGGGGGPMQAGPGGQGMPEPRKVNGQPRQDRDTPAQSYVVKLTYNDLAAKPGEPNAVPAGETVMLVGYAADESVVVSSAKTDALGRATFTDLDPSGSIGYFVLTNLARGAGVDRLHSIPVQMDGKVGVRTILSGEKKDSTAPNIDQYVVAAQSIPTPAGKVRVTLEGMATPGSMIQLFDAATRTVVAKVAATQMEGDPTTVQGGSKFEAKADVQAGTVDVFVHGGVGADGPLGDVEIYVIAADAQKLEGIASKTDAAGKVRVTGAPADGKPQRVVFKILGREFVSEPFDISKGGGALDITAKWGAGGRPQAVIDVPYKPNQVLYAETTQQGKLAGTYRSLPFMQVEQSGIHLAVIVYPRLMLKFKISALIEDQLLAVQGRWQLENHSWIPYRHTADGLLIPAPKGFKGGVVAEMNQNDVAVVPGEGFRIMRPLPPGAGTAFVGGFSLPVDSGEATWALDLPFGTVNSEIHIRQTPGMKVQLPAGVNGTEGEGRDGNTYYNIQNISIGRGKSMVMAISGLPSPPAWKIWVPRFVGVLVIMTILGGVGIALFGRGSAKQPSSQAAARKAALLDELVELERSGADHKRKEQLIAELEKLW